ncbi:MAG: guanylate cyclase [Leptospiraceae bacterium]|nr:MAG: guanylate cyclase [Leptospiraceae bacterium]
MNTLLIRFLLFFFILLPYLYADNIKPIIYENTPELYIGKNIYIYEDKDQNLNITTIKNKLNDFKQSDKIIPNFGYTDSSFWIYFKILNPSRNKQKILLELYYPLLDEVDYYLFESGKLIQSIETGDRRPFFNREIHHKNFLFLLNLEPQKEYEIFFRIKSEGSVQIPLRLISYQTFIEEEHIEQFIQGIYYGIMIAMIFYNLFLLLSIRDISYFYYILYIFGIMLFSLIYSGYAFEFLWPAYPGFGNTILPITIGFLANFAGIFTMHFLRMKELTPKLYNILFGLNIIFFLIVPLSLILPYKIIIKIATYSILPFALIAFIGSFLSYKKGWKPARFYITAWTMVLIGMFVLSLKQLGKLPSNFFTDYSLQIGSALEVILLSLGLADRINVLKQEKEKARNELLNTKIIMLESFSRFVPKHFANILRKETILDVQPGDATEKELAVLFNDIKNFSTLAEMMSAKETFEFLNTYFEIMNPIILKYRGFIDKFIGDEIMALFDCEADFPLDAAIEMRLKLDEFNKKIYKLNLPDVDMGIGINYGKAILGTVGSQDRLDTTVIGDTVNTAERIQQLTRIFKTPILITENVKEKIQNKDRYYLRRLQKVRIKGKFETIQIYECFNTDSDEQIEKKLKTLHKYEEAMQLINEKDIKNALLLLKEILHINPKDTVVKIYLEKMEKKAHYSL